MDNYKATPEQWKNIERWAEDCSTDACVLELRSRVEALEAQAGNNQGILDSSTPPPVATDEELRAAWNVPGTNLDAFRAIYDLGVAHGKTGSREVAEPAPVVGGLVDRVAYAINGDGDMPINWRPKARAAIFEVARWLRENECGYNAVCWLEQEAGR